MAGEFLVIAASSGLGAFVGLDRSLAGARHSLSAHALAGTLGLLALELIAAGSVGVPGLQGAIQDVLILASIFAVPIGFLVLTLVHLLGLDDAAEPPGDLVSMASAAWLGAACAAGSWRFGVVCLIVLVMVHILRPRGPKEETAPADATPLAPTPLGPRMVLPDAPFPALHLVTASGRRASVSRHDEIDLDEIDLGEFDEEDVDLFADHAVPVRLVRPVRDPAIFPLAARQPRRQGRSGYHMRDARQMRGYSLQHHRRSRRLRAG